MNIKKTKNYLGLVMGMVVLSGIFEIVSMKVYAKEECEYQENIAIYSELENAEKLSWEIDQSDENNVVLIINSNEAMDEIQEWEKYQIIVNSIVINQGVTYIGENAFKDFESLRKVVLNDQIEEIYAGAFDGCSGLADIDLPTGIKKIGDNAFRNCSTLTILRLPKQIEEIGDCAFYGCQRLAYLIVPEQIKKIGEYALGYTNGDMYGENARLDTFELFGCSNVTQTYALDNDMEYIDLSETEEYAYWKQYTSDYYYNQFGPNEQSIWDELEQLGYHYLVSDDECSKLIDVKIENIFSFKEWADFCNMFRMSHPQFFFISNVTGTASDGITPEVGQIEIYDKFKNGAERKRAKEQFKEGIEEWIKEISIGQNEVEQLRIMSGLLSREIKYDLYDGYYTQGAWDAVCNKETVCQGFSVTTQLLCKRLGIECIGVAAEEHAFNMVNIDGGWYKLCNTGLNEDFDDQTENDNLCDRMNWGEFFLMSDKELTGINYIPQEFWEPYVPKCPVTWDKTEWITNPHIMNDEKFCFICNKTIKNEDENESGIIIESQIDNHLVFKRCSITNTGDNANIGFRVTNVGEDIISPGFVTLYLYDCEQNCIAKGMCYISEIQKGESVEVSCELEIGDENISKVIVMYENEEPTTEPTVTPTVEPTTEPTIIPTVEPTTEPTIIPTVEPTTEPTVTPTAEPTTEPTVTPTVEPTTEPTIIPTTKPTGVSSETPSKVPELMTQTITVAPKAKKTVIYKSTSLKKKKATLKLAAKAETKLTYKVSKYPKNAKKYIAVSKKGVITMKKGAKKGIYKVTVTAKEDSVYKQATKVITIKVK